MLRVLERKDSNRKTLGMILIKIKEALIETANYEDVYGKHI